MHYAPVSLSVACLKTLWFNEAFQREMDIGAAHDGTCQWLSSHPAYKTWVRREQVNDHGGILWIAGKPGSGKSVLIKKTINRIKELYGSSASVIAFFFNARGTSGEKTAHGFFQSLLYQLLKQHREWPRVLGQIPRARRGRREYQMANGRIKNQPAASSSIARTPFNLPLR